MEKLRTFDYALLMLGLTAAILAAYSITKDPMLGDILKIALGSTITAFGTRVTNNTAVVQTSGEAADTLARMNR